MTVSVSAPAAASAPAADSAPVGAPGRGWRQRARAVVGAAARAPFTRRTRAELGYVLLCLPLALVGFVFTVASLGAGGYFAIAFAGLLLVGVCGYGARAFGVLHRRLARGLLGMRIAEPVPFRPARGLLGWLRSALTDPVTWRAFAYLAFKLPLAVVDGAVAALGWLVGLYYLTYPVWWALFHRYTYYSASRGRRESVIGVPFPLGHLAINTAPGTAFVSALGVVAVLVAPWATRATVALDRRLIRWLLSPTSLSERVRDLERTRAQAVDESADRLRQIERDLHDGAQARLVALVMKLGLAKEKLGGGAAGRADPPDVERAYQLVDTAHQTAKEAINELRELARGIYPPVLDEGLDAALGSLAARSEVPVEVSVALDRRPSPAIEAAAYFCVAELLANVAKHSRARYASIEAREASDVLRIRVTDDGIGGASLSAGTGLRGLADRAATVDGWLELDSPVGGPTVAVVNLPLPT